MNNTSVDIELAKLIKQKAVITGVPYLFSLVTMGFVLSGVSRIWTKYRYNQQQKAVAEQTQQSISQDFVQLSPAFQGFKVSLAGQK